MEFPVSFGNFVLLKKIATGGMAETFLARHAEDSEPGGEFVIKRLLPHLAGDAVFTRNFQQEAVVASTLEHPNVAGVFHFAHSADGEPYIAMEYVWGEDLRRVAERGMTAGRFLSIEQSVAICAHIADALAAVHSETDDSGGALHLVHRDVSPPNIMVGFDGRVCLLDFGIAASEMDSEKNIRRGQLQGKVGYMSPEQVEGLELDRRSDVFALGTVLYEYTTRKRLFKGANDLATMKLVADAEVSPPSGSLPSYPAELERIVLKALSKDREERYASAAEMRDDLHAFLKSQESSIAAADLPGYMRRLFPDRMEQLEELLGDGYAGPTGRAVDMAIAPEPVVEPEPTQTETAATPVGAELELPPPPLAGEPEQGSDEPLDMTDLIAEEPSGSVTSRSHTLRKVRADKFEKAAERSRQTIVIIGLIMVALAGGGLWYNANYNWPWEGISSDPTERPDVTPRPPRELPETVAVQVFSEPAGAAVAANGIIATGTTPTTVQLVPDATNSVSFYLDGYQTLVVDVEVGAAPEPLSAALRPVELPADWIPPVPDPETGEIGPAYPMGKLHVTTNPAGASIFLNGVESCTSPCRLDVTAGHDQHVMARRFGHLDTVSHAVALPFGGGETDVRFLPLELQPVPTSARIYTFFNLDSYPDGADINLNGSPLGRTPTQTQRLLDELYRIEVSAEGFEPWARSFMPAVGRFELRPILRRIPVGPALLSLTIDMPDQPGTLIYLGKVNRGAREVGTDQIEAMQFESGEYELTLSFRPPADSGFEARRSRLTLTLPPNQHVTERYAWDGQQFVVAERTVTDAEFLED